MQLFLSHNGLCSRRKAFDFIQKGLVKVNDAIIREPSFRVDEKKDVVCLDGKKVIAKKFQYVLLHKPGGYVTTVSDRFAEKTVFDLLPLCYSHLAPVGRLDKDTEGLLLFTNDGDLAYRLTHPKFNVYKKYFVRISGLLKESQKERIQKGVVVDDKKTAPAKIENIIWRGNETELFLTIHEGRKRQIRLMFPQVGHSVVYLRRVMQGPLQLGDLKKGQYRELKDFEVELLKK
ncbi:MAG TPA: pseudouridine synthase [Candidatus Omnitrophota bacterium]|nr:pseudouridine synthase [Candidatus Omnitrophota bacterium]